MITSLMGQGGMPCGLSVLFRRKGRLAHDGPNTKVIYFFVNHGDLLIEDNDFSAQD
jgi:hypothetical protein